MESNESSPVKPNSTNPYDSDIQTKSDESTSQYSSGSSTRLPNSGTSSYLGMSGGSSDNSRNENKSSSLDGSAIRQLQKSEVHKSSLSVNRGGESKKRKILSTPENISRICPICMKPIEPFHPVLMTVCDHTYHDVCLEGWMAIVQRSPRAALKYGCPECDYLCPFGSERLFTSV